MFSFKREPPFVLWTQVLDKNCLALATCKGSSCQKCSLRAFGFKPYGGRHVWSSFNEGSDKGEDERALKRLSWWFEPALGLLFLVTLATDSLSDTCLAFHGLLLLLRVRNVSAGFHVKAHGEKGCECEDDGFSEVRRRAAGVTSTASVDRCFVRQRNLAAKEIKWPWRRRRTQATKRWSAGVPTKRGFVCFVWCCFSGQEDPRGVAGRGPSPHVFVFLVVS